MPFINTSKIEEHEILPGYRMRPLHTKHSTHVHWSIDKDAILPEHSHPHEQTATVLKGEFELTIDGETQVLKPGMVAVIPSNAVHSGKAITDCELQDVFCPVREDYVF